MPRQPPAFHAYTGTAPPRFANEVELECAKMLDFYGVPWAYEPRTFVLERDADGRVTRAFTPDFYLPDQDLYVEVTVMRQSLVTRKNRKLRELRRLYPGGQGQALLPARHRAPRPAITTPARHLVPASPAADGHPIGEVYLTREEIARRVAELGVELAAAYDGLEPLLVAPLKSSTVFLADLSRALPIAHGLDFLELAAYAERPARAACGC